MLRFIFFFFLLISSSYQAYQEIEKYDSVEVIPDTKVYIDISSFNVGDLISIELGMELHYIGSPENKQFYIHKVGQVSSSTYFDSNAWNNLPSVKNSNVTCDIKDYCIFRWEEIKQIGNNFVYILPLTPFSDFYSKHGQKIKISMIEEGKRKGPSVLGIVGIVLGCIGIISLIISIILYCRICTRKNHINSDNNSAAPMIPEVKEAEKSDNKPPEITEIKPAETTAYIPPTQPYSNSIN